MSDIHYDDQSINFLAQLWGEGYMSPGGAAEVSRVLENVDLTGKRVLDIGSGSGAITVSLVQDHGAGSVVGIDVEEPVCTAARTRIADLGLQDRVDIQLVEPGDLPFADTSFDIVFSKDSIIHIPDKEALAAEAFRVLRPGGVFAASDWLTRDDGKLSAEMEAYIEQEGLGFEMASPRRYAATLNAAGFADTALVNRNRWYLGVAEQELALFTGADGAKWRGRFGDDFMDDQIKSWQMMVGVLRSGEHCPHHLFARKPG